MSRAPGYEVDWNLVRTFVSVVEAGSLAGAARTLKLAHPTVARHIQQLENQLGVSLFERCAGGLVLNEAGQRLADVAERMRRQAMQLETACESVREKTTGRVRVTIAEVFADLFPELLAALKVEPGWDERYVELIVSPRRLNLLDREADIAVRIKALDAQPPEYLLGRKVVPVVTANYVAVAHERRCDPEIEGSTPRWIAFDDRKQVEAMIAASSYPQVPAWGAMSSLAVMVQATKAGLGRSSCHSRPRSRSST